jgi:hypothetical protein
MSIENNYNLIVRQRDRLQQLKPYLQFISYAHKIITPHFEYNTFVCFQHKMADAISIPMYVFHNGAYIHYNDDKFEINHIGSIFKKCPTYPTITELIKNDVPDETMRCPPTYYKDIVYTYKGDLIIPSELNDVVFLFDPIYIPRNRINSPSPNRIRRILDD